MDARDSTKSSGGGGATWALLRGGYYRTLWIAVLVSNVGYWMQTVGAQWLLVNRPGAAVLVALVQTADSLPDMLFAYVGGVLADMFDRRKFLLVTQVYLTALGLALTLLTMAGRMPPVLLLIFTFLLGVGAAVSNPAYQAMIPDVVSRTELPAASALSAVNINISRVIGPAIGGLIIAQAGVTAVFALNVVAFIVFGLAVAAWRPAQPSNSSYPEPFSSALRAGEYYVRYSPVVRRILIRLGLFLFPASSLWALLPLVATEHLGLKANGYGLLLGSLGVGAVAGAFVLPRLHTRLSHNAMLLVCSLFFAASLVALLAVSNPVFITILLIPTGIAWVAILTALTTVTQLFLPGWVRARGLAVFQTILFGTQAIGAAVWGYVAGQAGLFATFLIAAAVMAVGTATLRFWPLLDTRGEDRSLAVYWPEHNLATQPDLKDGPILVMTTYTIAPENEQAFLDAMDWVRRSRLRTGAVEWGLYRDGQNPRHLIEFFQVPSWEEHLRQHNERLTGADRQFEERARALSNPPSHTEHLIGAHVASE